MLTEKEMGSVLITDDCHPCLQEGLEGLGWRCHFRPDITPEEALAAIADYEGLVINSKIWVDGPFLDRAPRLRFVARLGSGMEVVDRHRAAEKGVAVFSSPEGNRNAVAEQALGMLLCLANKICQGDRQVRQAVWQREANRGWEIKGKTVGIVGFGHTGSQFARKLEGFEARVLAYDKYKADGYAAQMGWVRETSLEEIQRYSDIISLHLPLTPETKHLFDRAFAQKCKQGLVLINTSRGKCVKTSDLVDLLETGILGGACLDVFENEKPETRTAEERELYERLHRLENVVLTPHVAGWTHESKKLLAETLLEKISIWQNGHGRDASDGQT